MRKKTPVWTSKIIENLQTAEKYKHHTSSTRSEPVREYFTQIAQHMRIINNKKPFITNILSDIIPVTSKKLLWFFKSIVQEQIYPISRETMIFPEARRCFWACIRALIPGGIHRVSTVVISINACGFGHQNAGAFRTSRAMFWFCRILL